MRLHHLLLIISTVPMLACCGGAQDLVSWSSEKEEGGSTYSLFQFERRNDLGISDAFRTYAASTPHLSKPLSDWETYGEIYNITPKEFEGDLKAELYRYDGYDETYLVYKNEVTALGTGFGGYGALHFALQKKGEDYGLFFAYSFGSGIHRGAVGYFDFKSNAIKELGYKVENPFGSQFPPDLQFVLSKNNTLDVYESEVSYTRGKSYSLTPKKLLFSDIGSLSTKAGDPPYFPVGSDDGYLLVLTGSKQFLITELQSSYKAGEKVVFETSVLYDADLDIYLNGEKITQTGFDAPAWVYEFIMPEKDSVLDFRVVSGDYDPDIPWTMRVKVDYDYGMHRENLVTMLFDYTIPYVQTGSYDIGPGKLVAGDVLVLTIKGELWILESYPGVATGDYQILDVKVERATVEEIEVVSVPGGGVDVTGNRSNPYVINSDGTFANLDTFAVGTKLYASKTGEGENEKIEALYSYYPR